MKYSVARRYNDFRPKPKPPHYDLVFTLIVANNKEVLTIRREHPVGYFESDVLQHLGKLVNSYKIKGYLSPFDKTGVGLFATDRDTMLSNFTLVKVDQYGNRYSMDLVEEEEDYSYEIHLPLEKNEVFELDVDIDFLVDAPCGNVYTHYKGKDYKFLLEATQTESGELLVIYKDSDNKHWARPYGMFHGFLEDGTKRFVKKGE